VNTVYNGCGLLVAQMKAGGAPDGYFACDDAFFEPVKEKFLDPRPLTENDLVIAVQNGNPKKIAGLKDLAGPGLRVGLAHPEKSALGVLSRTVLDREGMRAEVEANLSVDSPTGDFLVNQLRVGGLDAAIVYRSNVQSGSEDSTRPLGIVSLGAATAIAVQPFARAKGARHPRLIERFFDTVLGAESRAGFEGQGFTWRARK
jgi:ABC-type molybdate transport system substrate-binding protein